MPGRWGIARVGAIRAGGYAYVHRAAEGGLDLTPFTALHGWFARIEARPAYLPIDHAPE